MNRVWFEEFTFFHDMRKQRLSFNGLVELVLANMEKKYSADLMNQAEVSEAFTKEFELVLIGYKSFDRNKVHNQSFEERFEKLSRINKLVLKLLYSNLYLNRICGLPKSFNKIISIVSKSQKSVASFREDADFWLNCSFNLLITAINQSYKFHLEAGLGTIYPSIGLDGLVNSGRKVELSDLLNAVIESEKSCTKKYRSNENIQTPESCSFQQLLSSFPVGKDALSVKVSRSRQRISRRGAFYIGSDESKIFEDSVYTRYIGEFGVGSNLYLRSVASKKFEKPSRHKRLKAKILNVHKERQGGGKVIKFEEIFQLGEEILILCNSGEPCLILQ